MTGQSDFYNKRGFIVWHDVVGCAKQEYGQMVQRKWRSIALQFSPLAAAFKGEFSDAGFVEFAFTNLG